MVTVETARVRTTLRPDEKRREIARLAGMIAAAQSMPPHKAAGMLGTIWEARTGLDWGCRPVVSK